MKGMQMLLVHAFSQ